MNEIEKLELLRKRWKEEPENRKVIELQARSLKLALSLKSNKRLYGEDLVKAAEKIFR